MLFYLPAPRPHIEMRLNAGSVSIRRGELNKDNLCSYWNVIKMLASVQPKVNNINERDVDIEIVGASIIFLRIFARG